MPSLSTSVRVTVIGAALVLATVTVPCTSQPDSTLSRSVTVTPYSNVASVPSGTFWVAEAPGVPPGFFTVFSMAQG